MRKEVMRRKGAMKRKGSKKTQKEGKTLKIPTWRRCFRSKMLGPTRGRGAKLDKHFTLAALQGLPLCIPLPLPHLPSPSARAARPHIALLGGDRLRTRV